MKIFFLIVLFFFTLTNSTAQQNIDSLTIKQELRLQKEETYGALFIDANAVIRASLLTDKDELEYLDGVTSGVQNQIDGKQATLTNSSGLSSALSDESGTGLAVFGTSPNITTPTGIVKGDVGLGSVDNTSDANKPISTATQSALNFKANDSAVIHNTGDESASGVKTFTGKIIASSTVNSSHPCPTMTNAQMLAITSPTNGDCVHNSNNDGQYIYSSVTSTWKPNGGSGGISSWITSKVYAVDEVVIESNKIYKCLTAHTSGTFATDLSASKWQIVSGTIVETGGITPLANGGTNKNLTAVNGGVIYTDADSHEVSAAGTSGQELQSNGAAAPTWVNKSISGKAENKTAVTLEEIQFPNNQLTQTASGKYLASTGNKNILDNAGFEHSTFSTSWTNSAGTFTQETSTVIDGKASAKLVLSSQTMSLTQSSTLYAAQFADGVQGLASVRIKSNVAVKVCAIQAGTVSTVDCVDVANDNKWSFYKIPFILGATSNGISIASSGAVSGTVYIDEAFVGAANVTDISPIVTSWANAGVLSISASTTNPTKGVAQTDKMRWRRVGDSMQIEMVYRQTTGGSAGSGDYRFAIPVGYEIDLSKVTAFATVQGIGFGSLADSKVGSFFGSNGASSTLQEGGSVYVVNSTTVSIEAVSHASGSNGGGVIGSGYLPLSTANQNYRLELTVPVVGWGSNSSMYSAPCGANCVDVFSAKVTDGAATTTVSQENVDFINGNCTNATTGAYVCTFNTGIFTVAPNCTASSLTAGGATGAKVGVVSSSSVTVNLVGGAGGALDGDFQLICQKQGADFTAARTIVGSFKGVVSTQGKDKPINGAAIVAAGSETTSCTVTGNCTLYRSRGDIFTSIAKTSTTGTYTVTLDSTKINTSTALCTARQMHTTSANSVCYTSSMGSSFSVFCRDVTTNAAANALFNIGCDGDLP